MTSEFITLGETMIKLTPPGYLRLEQTTQLDVTIGGAESNVAVALARMGKSVAWASRLPNNPLGQQIANKIRSYGIDVSGTKWVPNERVGVYYAEYASNPRPIRVWYDRADSAASKMTPDDLPLDLIAEAQWLHLTGITPALSQSCTETVRAAMQFAKENNVKITFDVNYRALLWTAEEAAQTLAEFCEMADVVMVAGRDAVDLFHASDIPMHAVQELQAHWGGTVIVTDGENGIYGYRGREVVFVEAYTVDVVDRFGAGDAMAAGIICRLMEDAPLNDALRFGAALAALHLTIPGDFALVSRYEVEALIKNEGSQVRR